MKKIVITLAVLVLVTGACGTTKKVEPTPVPPLVGETSGVPVVEPTTPPVIEPTDIPTVIPPTEAAPLATPTVSWQGEVLFSDNFSNSNSGWDQATEGNDSTDYADGKYRIFIETTMQDVWTNPYQYFDTDVIIDVDVEQTQGTPLSDYGVICGYVDIDNFHALTVGSDGWIEIFKYIGGERTTIYSEEANLTVDPSGNHLTASCVGTSLTLLVNGTMVVKVDDPDLTYGDVGMVAGTFEEGNVEFFFDNFVVTAAR
ncbi:MAG: hypothetical protein WA110_09665 [Anaerolineaceae bacterium]